MPTWSILIATLASRQVKLRRLLDVLLPQAETGGVEVVGLHNRAELLIGDYRQALLESARGEYVSFVDDDDMVEPDYVPVILKAMAEKPDYVAFQHAYYESGVRNPWPTITGLEHRTWHDGPDAYYRDVTHVNPVRTELARQASFVIPLRMYEDRQYDATIRKLARTQVVIPRVLYHYQHEWSDSVQWGIPEQPDVPPLAVVSPVFRWHEWSYEGASNL